MSKLELIDEFETITDEILAIKIDKPNEQIIKEIQVLLSKRDEIIESVEALDDDQQIPKDVLLRIMQKNTMVEARFEEVKLKLDMDLKGILKEKSLSAKKKKAHRGYLNPGHQNDGYFIDGKK
jgi:hypothetical protein